MVIKVDNKELMEYFESWLEDFTRVSEAMLEKINVDRGATLKIPESDFRKLRMLTESMDGLAKKKFGFENAPDFAPMVASMKRLEACIDKIYIPEEIEVKIPNIEFPAIPAPVIDFAPVLQGFQDMEKMFQKGIPASITNWGDMPLVFDKGSGSATSGGGDATEATLQSILSALADVVTNTAAISIDADSVNLNTDTLETLIAAGNAHLATLVGTVALLTTIDADTSLLAAATQVEDSAYTVAQRLMMTGGVRRDADTSPVTTDGDVHPMVFDELGYLKVSTHPASTSSYTDTITVNGDTVALDVSRYSNLTIHCTGTFSTVNVTFEGSINGGTTWFTVQGVRTSTNTVETTTGNLSAAPAYAWEFSVNALTNFRVRATAFTSGTQTWVFSPGTYATEPIPALQTHAVTGSGNFAVTMAANATTTPAKARDGVAGATDTGIPNFFIRSDAPTAVTPAAGDWEVPQISANGEQWVRLAGELADDAAFTPGTTRVVPIGFLYDDTATDSVDEGDAGAARMSANRNQYIQIRDGAGNERGLAIDAGGALTANLSATDNAVLDAIAASLAGTLTVTGGGGGTEYTEDAAAAANPVGNALMLVREDGRAGSLTTTDGDNVALRGNNKGEAYVKDTDAAALLATIDGDTGAMATDLAAIEILLTTIEANQLADSHNVTVDNASIAVTGTFWQATQPISGTITAELSAIDNAVLDTIDAVLDTIKTDTAAIVTAVQTLDNAIAGNEMQVDVLTMPTITVNAHAVTNAGTFAVQVDGNALTALQLIDDVIFADDAAFTLGTSKGAVMAGIAVETDGTDPTSVSAEGDAAALRTDRNRRLLTNDMHPNSFVLFEDHTTAQTNNQLKAAPGAGLSIYITDVIISNGATAGSLKLVEDEGGTPVQIGGTVYLAITGGAVMNFKTPKRLTANKSLGFTSATVTTHSIEIHGYIAP